TVFLSVRRRPPSSPLFPYTTLFRSIRRRRLRDAEDLVIVLGRRHQAASPCHVSTTTRAGRISTPPSRYPDCSTTPTVVLTWQGRSEEHTSELQSRFDLVCRLPLEKK